MTMAKRSYGTGSLWERADSRGRVSWYAQWSSDGRRIRRVIGSRDEMNRRQAEAKLRELMAEVKPKPRPSEVLTISELGRRYIAELERKGRKKATRVAVDSAVRVHLEPFFGKRAITSVTYEDVEDLVATHEAPEPEDGPQLHRHPLAAVQLRLPPAAALGVVQPLPGHRTGRDAVARRHPLPERR
jgi:hypothetical protein